MNEKELLSPQDSTDNLRLAVTRCLDDLNSGLKSVIDHIYDELAELDYLDLKTIVRHIDSDYIYLIVSMGYSYKEAFAKMLDHRITRITTENRETIMRKILNMKEDQARELAYRLYVLKEVIFVLKDEAKNLIEQ